MIEVERLTESRFLDISQEWNSLLKTSSVDNFFLSSEWLSQWWRHFGKGKELLVLAFHEEGDLIGIAPLYRERKLYFKHLPVWRIGFLGTEMVHSDYLDLIAKTGREREIASHLMKYLAESSFAWDLLELNDIQEESPTLLFFRETAPTLEYPVSVHDGEICPYLTLQDTVAKYQSDLRKKTRYDIRRGTKDLKERFGQDNVVLQKFSSSEASHTLPEHLSRLFSLHRSRWAVRKETSRFGLEEIERFHTGLLPKLLKNGTVAMFSLAVQEKTCAIIYGFVYAGKYYFYQSGFDPEFKLYNPGLILVNFAIEKAIETGLSEYDFLRGDEAYKTKFTKAFRQSYHLRIWNNAIKRGYLNLVDKIYSGTKKHAKTIFRGK